MVSIVKAQRSAIGKYNGMYKDISLADLGASLLKNISCGLKIDELILGNVLSSGLGQNIARQISIKAGLDEKIPSFLVNKVCGSGLKAIELGYQSILCGNNKTVVVGGVEKMTGAYNLIEDGLTDAFNNVHMGITAENVANKYGFSRKELDDFAFLSQMRTKNSIEKEYFKNEIYNDDVDEYPRLDLKREKLDTLKPAFKEDGLVTAANSSGINDGVAMLVLMDTLEAKKENIEILAEIKGFASSGCDPLFMGLAPIFSTQELLKRHNLTIEDIDLFEINEAFSSVVLAYSKELNIPLEKINVNGGAISLGHPIGVSGARIVITLIHELIRRNLKRGIASLCIGGGQGISILIER